MEGEAVITSYRELVWTWTTNPPRATDERADDVARRNDRPNGAELQGIAGRHRVLQDAGSADGEVNEKHRSKASTCVCAWSKVERRSNDDDNETTSRPDARAVTRAREEREKGSELDCSQIGK